MGTLAEILLAAEHKDAVVSGCVQLIEQHIAGRGGFKGIALRTGMAMLKAAKPGILERATDKLLPEFIEALEPLHQQFKKSGQPDFGAFLKQNTPAAAAALLGVADRKAHGASAGVQSTYAKFRGGGEAEVQAVIPGLAQLISSHLG